MSRRKNILLLALLLLVVGIVVTYFTINKQRNLPAKEEVAMLKDSTEVKSSKPAPKVEVTPPAEEQSEKPIEKVIKKQEAKKIVKLNIEDIKPIEEIKKIDIGAIKELITDNQKKISNIEKTELIFEPIDLPKVAHYVYLENQRVESSALFVPKGQWLFGGTLQYTDHTNANYKLLVLDDWEGNGYTMSGSMYVGYAIKDNLALGIKGGFGRTLLNIDNLNINLGDDLNFNIDHAHYLNQQWSGTLFMRNFFSLFRSRQFGLFNDTEITFSGGRGKMINGTGEALKGTYESFFKTSIGISPGIMVFMQNIAAIEVSVGILGFNTSNRKQITNQVYEGSRRTSGAKFGVDILSVKLGATIYLNSRRFKQR